MISAFNHVTGIVPGPHPQRASTLPRTPPCAPLHFHWTIDGKVFCVCAVSCEQAARSTRTVGAADPLRHDVQRARSGARRPSALAAPMHHAHPASPPHTPDRVREQPIVVLNVMS